MGEQELIPIKNNLLYYPYINLPENAWLIRMLLYYDKIGTITPPDYIYHPDQFRPYTLDLIKENLVVQIFPSQYVYSVDRFDESFKEYIDSLGHILEARRIYFKKPYSPFRYNYMKIHISKMEPICNYLVHSGLAEKADDQWYYVERDTGLDFMSYLAAIIGKVDEAGFIPISDNNFALSRLVRSVSHDMRVESKTGEIRIQLLRNLFPAPTQPIEPLDILRFKERHSDKLFEFRNHIENAIIDILNITDSDLRERRIALFMAKAQEDIEEITIYMREHGWIQTTCANLYGLVSEIPVIGVPLKITQKVYKAATDSYSTQVNMVKETPLLYAAVARKELLKRSNQITKKGR